MAKPIPLVLYELLNNTTTHPYINNTLSVCLTNQMLESLSWISSNLSSLFGYLDIFNSKSKEWVFVSYAYVYDMCIIIIILL